MMADMVRITVNGRHALTVEQLAEATGLKPGSMRPALKRLGITPDAHLDGRTPLYLAAPTLKRLKERPGRWPTGGER
jgi:hypothetical protein